jgi:hypothetical protein
MARSQLHDEIAKASGDILEEVQMSKQAAGGAGASQEELADALAFDDWSKRAGLSIDWYVSVYS